jgi:transcriptional regulator of acetoin/glycerol metabolism
MACRAAASPPRPGCSASPRDAGARAVPRSRADVARGRRAVGEADPQPEWTLIEDAERQLLERALKANGGNILATARSLGVSRGTLYRKISKYGLSS